MNPEQTTQGALVDLLNRALDEGVLIRADLIITLGDEPLMGVNLNAAIAGAQTMIDYGLWPDDEHFLDSNSNKNQRRSKANACS